MRFFSILFFLHTFDYIIIIMKANEWLTLTIIDECALKVNLEWHKNISKCEDLVSRLLQIINFIIFSLQRCILKAQSKITIIVALKLATNAITLINRYLLASQETHSETVRLRMEIKIYKLLLVRWKSGSNSISNAFEFQRMIWT